MFLGNTNPLDLLYSDGCLQRHTVRLAYDFPTRNLHVKNPFQVSMDCPKCHLYLSYLVNHWIDGSRHRYTVMGGVFWRFKENKLTRAVFHRFEEEET